MVSPHLEDPEELHALAPRHSEVVKPETLAKWRQWGVPEETIQRAIMQRQTIRRTRQVEEWTSIPNFGYKMPRLPEIEANAWGFAKVIDTEGHIAVRQPFVADKVKRIDRWQYRWEYYRPRINVKTRSYELTEEIANFMHTKVTIKHVWDIRIRAYALEYEAHAASSRAVRICHLTQAHLTVPEKKRRATEILTTYRERPSTPRSIV